MRGSKIPTRARGSRAAQRNHRPIGR
jgi:hypothetical protein